MQAAATGMCVVLEAGCQTRQEPLRHAEALASPSFLGPSCTRHDCGDMGVYSDGGQCPSVQFPYLSAPPEPTPALVPRKSIAFTLHCGHHFRKSEPQITQSPWSHTAEAKSCSFMTLHYLGELLPPCEDATRSACAVLTPETADKVCQGEWGEPEWPRLNPGGRKWYQSLSCHMLAVLNSKIELKRMWVFDKIYQGEKPVDIGDLKGGRGPHPDLSCERPRGGRPALNVRGPPVPLLPPRLADGGGRHVTSTVPCPPPPGVRETQAWEAPRGRCRPSAQSSCPCGWCNRPQSRAARERRRHVHEAAAGAAGRRASVPSCGPAVPGIAVGTTRRGREGLGARAA